VVSSILLCGFIVYSVFLVIIFVDIFRVLTLTFLQLPLKNGTIGCLLNVPITGDHVQDITHPVNNNKAQNEMIQTLKKYSLEDMPFAKEQDFDKIKWLKK
jgi:hypothetical protein